VFSSISSYSYTPYFVDQTFLLSSNTTSDYRPDQIWANRTTLEELDVSDCISAYARDLVTSRGDVLVVMDTDEIPNGIFEGATPHAFDYEPFYCDNDSYQWICAQDGMDSCFSWLKPLDPRCQDRLPRIRANSSGWTPVVPLDIQAKSCFSQLLPDQCKAQFSLHLAIAVLLLNLAKAIIMCLIVWGTTDPPLLTIGDAIASFLVRPDATTEGMCLVSKAEVESRKDIQSLRGPRLYQSTRKRWFTAASKTRWTFCISLSVHYELLTVY
jgi:hypothetical protein